jgi:hypothetical protein
MRQFFEAYRAQEKVSALLTQLPWPHHQMILSRCKRHEEREFYLRLTSREKSPGHDRER